MVSQPLEGRTAARRNIELKARLADLPAAIQAAERLATGDLGSLHQIDTYFHVPHGRLKLRETVGRPAELIAYHRSDAAEARGSDYLLVPVADAELLKQALSATLGVRVVVDKRRRVLLWHNARIHLDEVAGLGTFLEFEAVLADASSRASNRDTEGHAQLAELCRRFEIAPGDIIPYSYSDLLEKLANS
jgi:predicted adenylyl cyclase CyaB